ncbi:MAG TPA: hypothetical protein VE198_15220 [Actinoallomurus sp.]|jgi:hypothetical protein|nr:hypothetical protein [Actinoallomurus sp.]
MSDRTPNRPHGEPAAVRREPQVLGSEELIVYEAIATMRHPMQTEDLIATTGLEEQIVRAAIDRLAELEMIVNGEGGATVGPNDWDVRGAQ